MQEIFFTILVIWILFRIFGSSSARKNFHYTQNNYHKNHSQEKEGKTTVDFIPNKKDTKINQQGEYVDYEEVK